MARGLVQSLGASHPSHMRLLLALRALFFVLLLPGTVAGYRRAVPRWGFTTRPFQESTGSTA